MKRQEIKTEKIPLLIVYKQGNKIKFQTSREIGNFELYGFLKTYIKFLKEELLVNMAQSNDGNINNTFEK